MSKKFLMDKISSSSQIKQESEGEHPNKRIKAESEIKNDLNNNPINGNSAAGNDVEFFSFGGGSTCPWISLEEDVNKMFQDVVVKSSDGASFSCHGLLLASHSTKFHEMFKQRPEEIEVDLEEETLRMMLELIYKHNVKVPFERVDCFVAVIKEFGLRDVQTWKFEQVDGGGDSNPGEVSFGKKRVDNYRDMPIAEILGKCFKGRDGGFLCAICFKTIGTSAALKKHVQQIHVEETLQFRCKICSAVTKSRDSFSNHFRYKHPDCAGFARKDMFEIEKRGK